MSRAFAAGFAASAAIHAAVLAALWQGPSGGRPMDHDAAPGFALVWTDAAGVVGRPSSPNGANDDAPPLATEADAPAVTEDTSPVDAATVPAPPSPAALPLPPPLSSAPRTVTRPGVSPTPLPAPAVGPAGTGDAVERSTPAIGDGGTVLPASIGTRQDPTYPWEARRNRWQGTVLLAVTVSSDGRPIAIDIARSSGYGVLDEAAVEAVRQWRFVPARRNGVAVEDRVAVPITFRLRD